jgi:hypothetical protein
MRDEGLLIDDKMMMADLSVGILMHDATAYSIICSFLEEHRQRLRWRRCGELCFRTNEALSDDHFFFLSICILDELWKSVSTYRTLPSSCRSLLFLFCQEWFSFGGSECFPLSCKLKSFAHRWSTRSPQPPTCCVDSEPRSLSFSLSPSLDGKKRNFY